MTESEQTIAQTPLLWDAKPIGLPLDQQQNAISEWLKAVKGKVEEAAKSLESIPEFNSTAQVIALHKALDWILEAQRWTATLRIEPSDIDPKLDRIIREHESVIHTHYGGTIGERAQQVLSHYKRDAAQAISERKRMNQETLVYFRSIIMCAEMVGMGGTHHEKDARLRGMIELLNQAIKKLQDEEHNSLLDNWGYGFGSRSDYPYRSLLDDMRQLKAENQELKKKLNATGAKNPDRHPNDDLPI